MGLPGRLWKGAPQNPLSGKQEAGPGRDCSGHCRLGTQPEHMFRESSGAQMGWFGWRVAGKQKLWGLLRHWLGDFGASRPWRAERAGGGVPGALAPDVLLTVGEWDGVREGSGVHSAWSCTEGHRNQGLAGVTARWLQSGARFLPQLPRRLPGGRLAQGTAGVCERRGPREMVQGDKWNARVIWWPLLARGRAGGWAGST